MALLEGSPELVVLTPNLIRDGEMIPSDIRRCTMLAIEGRMAEIAQQMAARQNHPVSGRNVDETLRRHGYLSEEQRDSVRAMTSARQIEAVARSAGAGKSKAIEAAREAWEAEGYWWLVRRFPGRRPRICIARAVRKADRSHRGNTRGSRDEASLAREVFWSLTGPEWSEVGSLTACFRRRNAGREGSACRRRRAAPADRGGRGVPRDCRTRQLPRAYGGPPSA